MERDLPTIAVSAPARGAACGLTAAECRTCASLPPHQRSDWRASRMAAKEAASAALSLPAEALESAPPAPGTAARLRVADGASGPAAAPVEVAVSHRDGRGAAVVDVPGRRMGIDLERADGATGGERYFLTSAERAAAGSLTPAALWSLKEAAWKALGCDETTPFTALRLHFDGASRLTGVELGGRTTGARADVSAPWPGYILTVVWLDREEA